jgi:hypothetical protein
MANYAGLLRAAAAALDIIGKGVGEACASGSLLPIALSFIFMALHGARVRLSIG